MRRGDAAATTLIFRGGEISARPAAVTNRKREAPRRRVRARIAKARDEAVAVAVDAHAPPHEERPLARQVLAVVAGLPSKEHGLGDEHRRAALGHEAPDGADARGEERRRRALVLGLGAGFRSEARRRSKANWRRGRRALASSRPRRRRDPRVRSIERALSVASPRPRVRSIERVPRRRPYERARRPAASRAGAFPRRRRDPRVRSIERGPRRRPYEPARRPAASQAGTFRGGAATRAFDTSSGRIRGGGVATRGRPARAR